jgi:hypothetical protein
VLRLTDWIAVVRGAGVVNAKTAHCTSAAHS